MDMIYIKYNWKSQIYLKNINNLNQDGGNKTRYDCEPNNNVKNNLKWH